MRMRQIAIEAWVRRAILDYYLAFQTSNLTTYWSFPLHQAIEKMCKSYLMASAASSWENLESNEAARWIERFARELRHDLWKLVSRVSETVPALEQFVIGKKEDSFLDLLSLAYEEARYPKPIDQSIWSQHGFPAWVDSRNEVQAFQIGAHILVVLRDGHGIVDVAEGLPDRGISLENWDRFIRIWNLRVGSIFPIVGPRIMAESLAKRQ